MDRWPSEEPKAPDKNVDPLSAKDNNIIMKLKTDPHFPNCGKTDDYSPRVLPANKESSVSSLNEPDLKALLEEAMAYKRPKDIQGKSPLFKELLQSVESEKKFSLMSRPEKQSNRKPRRKQMNKKEIDKTTHEGPFQDLIVHMSDNDSSSKRNLKSVRCSPPQSASSDLLKIPHEGNSEVTHVPDNGAIENLDAFQELLSGDHISGKNNLDVSVGTENQTLPLVISPYQSKNEESEDDASKEATSLVKESSDNLDASKDISPEAKRSLDENGNAVSSNRVEALTERKAKARRLKAKNDKNTILSQHIEGHRSDIAQDIDAIMKYIESPKTTETKNSRQRNPVTLSKNTSRGNKISRRRDKSSETYSRKPAKSKESKLHKSSSMEEISISKFEDLTHEEIDHEISNPPPSLCKKIGPKVSNESYVDVTEVDPFGYKSELEGIDSEFLPVTKKNRKKRIGSENNFRNRSRKVSGGYRSEKVLSSYMGKNQKLEGFSASPRRELQRRKSISSIPSSDKSGDSSDLDSVHSFPVSSSKGKGNKPSVSLYTGSTPQISYADIARSVPSPSKLHADISLCPDNFGESEIDPNCNQRETIPTVVFQLPTKRDIARSSVDQEYPPLNVACPDKTSPSSDMFVEFTVHVPKRNSNFQSNCVNVEETVLIQMPSSDISEKEGNSIALDNQVSSKRPPVILMNSSSNDSNDVNDLVFGFEVNEQLLKGSNSESSEFSDFQSSSDGIRIILYKEDLPDEGSAGVQRNLCPDTSSNPSSDAPSPIEEHSPHHYELVDFISSEWEKVQAEYLSQGDNASNVVYFNAEDAM